MSAWVHPSAIVDQGAQLGDGTKVWHFSHVMPGARIGKSCALGQNVYVANEVVIGDRVRIQNNVSIYEGVVLEDEVFCGPSMVFTNVRNPRAAFLKGKAGFAKTTVRRGATLGANCTIVCGNEVGAWAFVGAGAVVTSDVRPHALMLGVPARQAGWMCECGERLPAGERPACACGRSYAERDGALTKSGGP